ncbi:MAG: NUDIX hydrolase [Planctomycetota bacterium]
MTLKPQQDDPQLLYDSRHLRLVARGRWEFVERKTGRPAVGIVAITPAQEVVLVEQHRPPVDQPVIELPAGLAGDIAGSEDEALLTAAQRELLEETGYQAGRWTSLGFGYSSPGLTSESIQLYLAEELERVAPGGGDETEQITVHLVPLDQVIPWLSGRGADLKLMAGLFLAMETIRQREAP